MTNNLNFVDWEKIADSLYRFPVPGGWLYRYSYYSNVSITFVPVPTYPPNFPSNKSDPIREF